MDCSGSAMGSARATGRGENGRADRPDAPFGAEKWMTLPSLLNMLTSSIAWMGCVLSFFSVACSFLSSLAVRATLRFCLCRGVPFPPAVLVSPAPLPTPAGPASQTYRSSTAPPPRTSS